MRDFIISELKKLNVIDETKLIEYVDFCLSHDQKEHEKFKTAKHHILPKAKSLCFEKYKDLNKNPWNGVYLLHKDHYYAHYLLCLAINERSLNYAWWRFRCGYRLLDNSDIDEINKQLDKYQDVIYQYKKSHSDHCKQIMSKQMTEIYNRYGPQYAIDKSKKSAKTMKLNGTYQKIANLHKKYQNEVMESGLTRAQETGKKISQTRKKRFESGDIKRQTGHNNSMACKILIYDSGDALQFECHGNFEKICKDNNLPRSFLKRSYQNDGIKFKKTKGVTQKFYDAYKQFEGWYAIKVK